MGMETMPGRRKTRARKKRTKRQKMLNLMERIKRKESQIQSKSPLYSCSEDVCNEVTFQESSDSLSRDSNHCIQMSYMDKTTTSSSVESKEILDPVIAGLEKRKSEFSSIKRASKRSRTSSLNRANKNELSWPDKNSSTSCLTSWLGAAEDIFVPCPLTGPKDIPKTKRCRDEMSHCTEDILSVYQPVKKTKNIDSQHELSICSSSNSTHEKMEISPILKSPNNKRSRHNSSQNNSFVDEQRSSESEVSPVKRPTKRTKSIAGKPSQISSELLEHESECLLPSPSQPNIASSVRCIITAATPTSSQTKATEHRPCSAPQLRSPELDSDVYGLVTTREVHSRSRCSLMSRSENESTSSSSVSIPSVPSTMTLSDGEDEVSVSSTVCSNHRARLCEQESVDFLRSVIWKFLSLGLMAAAQRRARWPTSLTVSKMLELCTWIWMKVNCWLQITKKAIRKSFRSLSTLMSANRIGRKHCCSCSVKNAQLEERLSTVEKELVKLRELFSSGQFNNRAGPMPPPPPPFGCPLPPPPPPPPPPPLPSLISGNPHPLKITKKKGDSTANKQISRMAITVEDIKNVQLKKTPSNTQGVRHAPAVTNRGPVVSMEMLRSVKLRPRSKRRSVERNKHESKFPFGSPRDAETFSRILCKMDSNRERVLESRENSSQ